MSQRNIMKKAEKLIARQKEKETRKRERIEQKKEEYRLKRLKEKKKNQSWLKKLLRRSDNTQDTQNNNH